MKNALLVQKYNSQDYTMDSISNSLQHIHLHLIKEIDSRQNLIDDKDKEIAILKEMLHQKDLLINELNTKISETQRNNEGNKQLIKKLVNDMVRKQQDIEWYKRTYESRSFLGTLKQKLFG